MDANTMAWVTIVSAVATLITSWGQFVLKEYLERKRESRAIPRKGHTKRKTKPAVSDHALTPAPMSGRTQPLRSKVRLYLLPVLGTWVAYITLLREHPEIYGSLSQGKVSWTLLVVVLPAVALFSAAAWETLGRKLPRI